MLVNTDYMVPMTDANQNFSQVVRMVDEKGSVVILKNNRPRYVVVGFETFEAMDNCCRQRAQMIDETAQAVLHENMQAFMELAK